MQKKFSELGSPNKMTVSMGHGAKAWVSDFNHPHYMAGRKAMKTGIPSTRYTLLHNYLCKIIVIYSNSAIHFLIFDLPQTTLLILFINSL